MARIRTIKPEFFTSEDVVGLSPLARLLFIALWCEADREGRMVWKPRTFKLRYLPADDCDADALGQELINSGLVILYADELAYIPTFAKHQHLNPREAASLLPSPDASPSRARHVPDASARVPHAQGGREGKGREGKDKATPDGELLAGIDPQIASDFRAMRTRQRAPLTATAVAGIRREAEKAGVTLEQALATCCERGWRGFKAEWMAPKVNGRAPEPERKRVLL